MKSAILGFAALALGAFVFSACEKSACAEIRKFETAFPLTLGEKKISARVALTDLERQRGLTACRALPGDAGMLFVYPDENTRGFWMRGVPIGLSVGFFDAAGTLLETHEMRANDMEITYSHADNVKFVLEMAAGWFEQNKIAAGTRLRLSEIAAAIRLRGYPVENFEISSE